MKLFWTCAAWHIAEVAQYLYDWVRENKEPATFHFNDVRIIMFPEKQNNMDCVDDITHLDWDERPKIVTFSMLRRKKE